MEVRRQHPDDLVLVAIQRHRLSYDIPIPTVPLLPRCVAQHHGSGRARLVLAGIEIPPEYRRHSKRAKEPCADTSRLGRLSAARGGHYNSVALVTFQRREELVEFLPVEIVQIRKVTVRALGNVL